MSNEDTNIIILILQFCVAVVIWVIVGGGIGYWIGNTKGRAKIGFWMGLTLGVIGWIIVALISEDGIKCPECFGVVVPRATKCRHCGSSLVAPPDVPSLATRSSQEFYIMQNGEAQGPLSIEDMRTLIREGKLTGKDLCARSGDDRWQPIGRFL